MNKMLFLKPIIIVLFHNIISQGQKCIVSMKPADVQKAISTQKEDDKKDKCIAHLEVFSA